jgi:hypothetical protein
VGFYLTRPGGGPEIPFGRIGGEDTLLGFGAQALVEVTIPGDSATLYVADEQGNYGQVASGLPAAVSGSTLEVALPYAELGKPDAGDTFKLRVVISENEQRDIQIVPGAGPAALVVPDLGLTTPLLTVADPEKDDYGPGAYVYPLDGVFASDAYDIVEFAVAEDDNNLIFRFTFGGPLNNDWGANCCLAVTLRFLTEAAGSLPSGLRAGRPASMAHPAATLPSPCPSATPAP